MIHVHIRLLLFGHAFRSVKIAKEKLAHEQVRAGLKKAPTEDARQLDFDEAIAVPCDTLHARVACPLRLSA